MGLYRRYYRQKRRSFAGAGDEAICGTSTFLAPSSIKLKDNRKKLPSWPLGAIEAHQFDMVRKDSERKSPSGRSRYECLIACIGDVCLLSADCGSRW
jgi:hypothetical protein